MPTETKDLKSYLVLLSMSYFFLWYILTSWIEQKEEKSPFDDVMYHTLCTLMFVSKSSRGKYFSKISEQVSLASKTIPQQKWDASSNYLF